MVLGVLSAAVETWMFWEVRVLGEVVSAGENVVFTEKLVPGFVECAGLASIWEVAVMGLLEVNVVVVTAAVDPG